MLNKNTIYRKVRFPFKIIHALIKYPMANLKAKKYTVLTLEETMDLLLNNDNLSISRYGDGELGMTTFNNIGFQSFDENLSIRLKEIMQEGIKNKNCLICMPDAFRGTKNMRFGPSLFWFFHKAFRFKSYEYLLNDKYQYGNTSITRPYIDYRDRNYSAKIFDLLKRIWDKRDVVIVEGEKTKLGMGNDLFDNATSIKRIICPAENAYSKLEAIKSSIRLNVEKDTLILGALGPTASILASQLCDEGYQFVDIGHVDVEYMWYLRHAILRETIEGKYVNESGVKTCSDVYDNDSTYINSIIDRVLS